MSNNHGTIGFFHRPLLKIDDLEESAPWFNLENGRRRTRRQTDAGVVLEIGSDGFFGIGGLPGVAQDTQRERARATLGGQIELCNAFLASFYSALMKAQHGIEMMVVTFEDAFSMYSLDTGPAAHGGSLGARQLLSHLRGTGDAFDRFPLDVNWQSVTATTLREMNSLLAEQKERRPTIAALYLESVVAAYRHEYPKSLALGWACAERCLSDLWRKETEHESKTRASDAARRKRLLDSRTFTTSVVIEWLYSREILEAQTYESLTLARRARNDWIHGLTDVPPEATSALHTAFDSLLPMVGVPTQLPHGSFKLVS